MSIRKNVLTVLFATVLALGLVACGGSGGTTPAPEPEPTPFETAQAAIAMAATAEDAQAAYDAVKDVVTGAEGDMLQAAVAARTDALAMMARAAAQRMAMMDAAGMIDTSDLSTQQAVDAARAAIVMLRGALAAAADVSDADKAMYMVMLDDAVAAVDAAQGGIDTATRRMEQMDALSSASMTLQTALTALAGQAPTQEQIDAANRALTDLQTAISGGADLTDAEKATYVREAMNAMAPITTAQSSLDDAEDDAKKAADAAMAVTAARLYAGIGAPAAVNANPARHAAYNVAGTPADSTADTLITVTTGDGTGTPTVAHLSLDKKTTVADNHGWEGKRYHRTSPAAEGTYEAIVYSNAEAPTQGKKFGSAAAVTDTGAYQYQLVDGALNVANGLTDANAARVAFTGITRTSGTETFKLPEGRPEGETIVNVPGSFHGVPGTYSCSGDGTQTCTATVVAEGFTLGGTGQTWTFKPTSAEARVTSGKDTMYASYGWWLHQPLSGSWTASAFHDEKGGVPAAAGLDTLQGTATYMGGAAGKYALASSTGGTNDAGHFTARATLEANFSENNITGTIDDFMGADGMARDWSVELKEAALATDGTIARAADDDTVWTIGDAAANASGEWSGSLRNNGTDLVPKAATGTFYSEYGTAGRMVGAFGANKE